MAASAQILCTKCGAASAEPRLECAKCGGRNARVCGKCGNQNSVAKNFCDQCGQPISQLGPVAPPPKTAIPGALATDIPQTAVRRIAPPPASPPPAAVSGGGLPAARSSGASPDYAPLADMWSAPPQSAAQTKPSPAPVRGRNALKVAAFLIALAAAGVAAWQYRESQKPGILVPKLGAEYLEALRTRDYARAYAMFSKAAKRNNTEAEFRASRNGLTWTWSGLRIEHQEPGAVLLAYDLKYSSTTSRLDHVLFTLEDGRWTRPYNWTLIRQVEDAFGQGDPERGFLLAETAATVNPRDPMAWGYLCEAAYYRAHGTNGASSSIANAKLPAETEARCLKSLELAQVYPSNLSIKSLYHLHAILADIEHHSLKRPDRALEHYATMLAFPDISPADQCSLLLARSQAYSEMGSPASALVDLDRAVPLCVDANDRDFIRRMRASLKAPQP